MSKQAMNVIISDRVGFVITNVINFIRNSKPTLVCSL